MNEYFKSGKEKLYSKLSEEKTLRRVAGSFYSFLATLNKVEKYVKLSENVP